MAFRTLVNIVVGIQIRDHFGVCHELCSVLFARISQSNMLTQKDCVGELVRIKMTNSN